MCAIVCNMLDERHIDLCCHCGCVIENGITIRLVVKEKTEHSFARTPKMQVSYSFEMLHRRVSWMDFGRCE